MKIVYILFNNHCEKSEILVDILMKDLSVLLGPEFKVTRFFNNAVHAPDLNDSSDWIPIVKKDMADSYRCLFLFSQELNNKYCGIGLISEALQFWNEALNLTQNKMIPICIDCCPDQLRQPKGDYEQVQDIIVPIIKQVGSEKFDFKEMNNNRHDYLQKFLNVIADRITDRVTI